MDVVHFVLSLMVAFELKHFVADYTLQNKWMIRGKGSFAMLGGYVHAGIHSVGTIAVLWLFGVSTGLIVVLTLAEFAIHYMLDFAKAHYGDNVSSKEQPRKFWAINGLDQFFHHMTYIGMVYVVVSFA